MNRFPKTLQLCRQSHCAQGAGLSGLCPDHLRASLRRRPLGDLLELLERMLERPLAAEDFDKSRPSALLN
jgi:hypothetical protein